MADPIDMPAKLPEDAGDEYTAENGVSYTWDGVKWVLTVSSANRAERLWVRDGVNTEIFPVYVGDDVSIRNDGGTTTTTITAEGTIETKSILINLLNPLPS